jgi:hypothetical protein
MIGKRQLGFFALAVLALGGCEEEKKTDPQSGADAAAQQGPAVDPDLAEAVQAASSKEKGQPGANPEGDGPPPNGIFAPGAANRELAKGAAPKITIGSEGSAPRVKLAAAPPAAGWKRNGSVDLTIRAGRNALPVITADLSFEATKAKPVNPGEAPPAANGGGTPVHASVVKASVGPGAAGAAELDKVVGKMKGSRLTFRVLPNGASDDFNVDLTKGAAKDLDALLRPLSEILAAVSMPFPDKPVGKGAFWMVTSRETVMGVDVVTYRMVRVEGIEGDVATLNLNIKRYAASTDLALPGVPAGSKLEQFQSLAEGELTVSAAAPLLPSGGSLRQNLVAMLSPAEGTDPSQRMTAQSSSEATLKFPPPGAKPAAKPAPAAPPAQP